MNEQNETLPNVFANEPDHATKQSDKLIKLEACRIKADDEYEEPDYTLSQNGTGFAPRGNIMALMAEMKHGKTFVNTTFAAALLRGEYMGLKAEIENAKVIFFDTEQDKADGQHIQRRVQYINGWDFKDDVTHTPEFRIYHLREYPFDQRLELITFAIEYYKPDVVFIDGIRDLLKDFNSLDESAELIQTLMEISSRENCAIWTVLHVNPNSEKMRGHLGTELGNKVTDVFRVTKKKNANTGDITFEVEHVAARHRDVDGWEFRINDGKPYGIPELLTQAEAQQLRDEDYAVLDAAMQKYVPRPGSISQTALQKAIKQGESIGSKKAYDMILQAVAHGIIEKAINNKYVYIGGKPITRTDEMPFESPNNEEAPY